MFVFFGLQKNIGTLAHLSIYMCDLQTGQTPLSIAQRLGYVSVVETLRTVTETTVITETTTVTEERYKPQNPEAMNETMFSDSEDEGK
jgi:ankyrin